MSRVDCRFSAVCRRLAAGAGLVVAAIGGISIVGWILDHPAIKGAIFNDITVKTNAAIGLMLVGVGLAVFAPSPVTAVRRSAGSAFAAIALAIGFFTLLEYIAGLDLGIDQLLFREPAGWTATSAPNRMGPPAALSLLLAGLALLLLEQRTIGASHLSQLLASAICLLGLMPIIGYLFGSTQLYAWAGMTNTALPTAIAMEFLGLGLFAARPERGMMAQLLAEDTGGTLLRRLIVPVVLAPIVLGWMLVCGVQWGWWDTALGAWTVMTVFIVLFTILLWRSAGA